jgi:hypothetical protein
MSKRRKTSHDPLLKLKNLYRGKLGNQKPVYAVSEARNLAHPQQYEEFITWLQRSTPAAKDLFPHLIQSFDGFTAKPTMEYIGLQNEMEWCAATIVPFLPHIKKFVRYSQHYSLSEIVA